MAHESLTHKQEDAARPRSAQRRHEDAPEQQLEATDASGLDAGSLLRLQRAAGNEAVTTLVTGSASGVKVHREPASGSKPRKAGDVVRRLSSVFRSPLGAGSRRSADSSTSGGAAPASPGFDSGGVAEAATAAPLQLAPEHAAQPAEAPNTPPAAPSSPPGAPNAPPAGDGTSSGGGDSGDGAPVQRATSELKEGSEAKSPEASLFGGIGEAFAGVAGGGVGGLLGAAGGAAGAAAAGAGGKEGTWEGGGGKDGEWVGAGGKGDVFGGGGKEGVWEGGGKEGDWAGAGAKGAGDVFGGGSKGGDWAGGGGKEGDWAGAGAKGAGDVFGGGAKGGAGAAAGGAVAGAVGAAIGEAIGGAGSKGTDDGGAGGKTGDWESAGGAVGGAISGALAGGAAGGATGGAIGGAIAGAGSKGTADGGAAGKTGDWESAGGAVGGAIGAAIGGALAGGAAGGAIGGAIGGALAGGGSKVTGEAGAGSKTGDWESAGGAVAGAVGGAIGSAVGGAAAGGAVAGPVGSAIGGTLAGGVGHAPEHEEAGGRPPSHGGGGAAGGAGAGGGGGVGGLGDAIDRPPPLGETIPEIPEPGRPELGAIGRLGHAPEAVTGSAAPHTEAPVVRPEAGQFESQAHGIEHAGAGAGGGGLLDTIVQAGLRLLQGIIGSVAGSAQGTASAVGGQVAASAGQAGTQAGAAGQAAIGEAHGAATTAAGQASGHIAQTQQQAKTAVGQAVGHAQRAPAQARGMLPGLVRQVLQGASALPTLLSPFGSIFGGIFDSLPNRMLAQLALTERMINGYLDLMGVLIQAKLALMTSAIALAGNTLQIALATVAAQLAALTRLANAGLNRLPSPVRSVLGATIGRFLGAVNATVQRLAIQARAFIVMAMARMQIWLRVVTATLMAMINAVRRQILAGLQLVRTAIAAAAAQIARLKAWLIAQAMAFISRAVRAVIGPIYQRARDHLLELIGPEVQQAVARAQLMFPNGLPAPPEVLQAATQMGQQAGSSLLADIRQGLLNPEGDHLSLGFQFGGSAGATVGVSGGVGASLEGVFDYRRNDIGFFVSPAAGGQVNIGDIGATGNLSGVGAWGTVASFGDPSQDVLGSWSGTFGNVTYGAQAGLAVEGGLAVSTGGSFYRGGAAFGPTLGSYTPLGADTHTVPGAEHPGTPGRSETMELGDIRFASGQDNPERAAGGTAAMDHAVELVRGVPSSRQGATARLVHAIGEASRRWRHPRPGTTREQDNIELAAARGRHVKEGLERRLGGTPPVDSHGIGDQRARGDGRPETDGSAQYQRTAMTADIDIAGTGPTRGPDQQAPNQFDVRLGNPFTSQRTAWGWDTTLGVTGLVGAAGKAGVYGGAGLSYSFPIGKTHCSASTMEKIRIAVGIVKILLDLISLSPLGLLRDIIALVRGGVAADAETQITNAVGDWSVPTPPGVGVA